MYIHKYSNNAKTILAKWKKDADEFVVSVMHSEHRNLITVPKPLMSLLDDPKSITFKVKNGKITIEKTN